MDYRLSWESFQTWTKESIEDLYEDTDYTDVTLITEDMQVFKSHRIILSSSSDFFKEILGKMKSFQGQTLYLKEIQGNILGLLLNFIYLGEVTVSQELIKHFLSSAVDLKIKGIDFEEKTSKDEKKEDNNEDTSNSFIKGIVFEEKASKDEKEEDIKEDDSLDMGTLEEMEMEIKLTEDQIKNESIPLQNNELKTDAAVTEKDEKRKIQKCSTRKKKKLINPSEVKSKSDSNNSEEFICIYDTCNETFKTSKEAKKHIMKTHRKPIKEKKFQCETCKKQFQTKHEAQLHWQYKHGNREKKFSCEDCDKKFAQSGDLKMHIKGVHLKIKDFHCTFCDVSFSQGCNLKTHMIKIHTEKYYNQLQVKELSTDKV